MTAIARRLDGTRGSIPLALLVIVALSGVIGALVLTVVGGSEQARFDQDYTEAIQPADTAAQEGAAHLIRTVSHDDLQDAPIAPGSPAFTGSGTTTDAAGAVVPYTWEASKVDALSWEVRGTATVGEVERDVVVEVSDVSRFQFAAFSDRGFEMRGSNGADSYGDVWFTENGIVASNENISLHGASTDVDGVILFDWRDNQSLARCEHQGGEDCEPVFGGCPLSGSDLPAGRSCTDPANLPDAVPPSGRVDEPLVIGGELVETAFIDEHRATECPGALTSYTTSTYGRSTPLPNNTRGSLGTAGTHTALCFEDFTIDRDLDVYGTVEIYVYGNLFIGEKNHKAVEVNCDGTGCAEGTSRPDAPSLTFYVDGSGDPDDPSQVKFGNGSATAAGIYAPESVCEGNPSNAQVDIFGSLICGSISNQGGWGFHYDDRLGDIGIGLYEVRGWREE